MMAGYSVGARSRHGAVLAGLLLGTALGSHVALAEPTIIYGTGSAFGSVNPQLLGRDFIVRGGGSLSLQSQLDASGSDLNIEDGVLVFQGGSTPGSATIWLGGPSTLKLYGAVDGGTASIDMTGAALLDLLDHSGPVFSIGSLSGNGGVVDLGSVDLVIGGNNRSTSFGGVIGKSDSTEGFSGGLAKVGTGTLTLTGNNIYTGATSVEAGALIVNGLNAGSVFTVDAGARLGGTGTIGGLDLSGRLAPGAAPGQVGTLTVQGDARLRAGSQLDVDFAGNKADRLTVVGSLQIDGATINISALNPSLDYRTPQVATVLSAGALSGADNLSVRANSSLLRTLLLPIGNSVGVQVVQAEGFEKLGRNKQEKEVGKAVSGLEPGKDIVKALHSELLGMSDKQAVAAMGKVVSPPPAQPPAPPALSGLKASVADMKTQKTGGASGGPAKLPSRPDLGFFASSRPAGIVAIDDAELEAVALGGGNSIWIAPFGGYGTSSSPGSVVWAAGGLSGGLQHETVIAGGAFTGGLMLGAQRTIVATSGPDSHAQRNAASAGAYAGWLSGDGTALSVSLSQSLELVDAERYVSIGNLDYTASASYLQHLTSLTTELGQIFELDDGLSITPVAGISAGWLNHGGYTETGAGALGLVVDPLSGLRVDGAVGIGVTKSAAVEGGVVTAQASLKYQRELLDGTRRQTMRFVGGTTAMNIETPAGDLDYALIGLGLSYASDGGLVGSVGYSGSYSANSQAHGISASLGSSF